MRFQINSRKEKLDKYFQRVNASKSNDEIRSDLAKHGAILICGFVERCVELVILERLSGLTHPRITKFIRSYFKRGTNYDCEAICQLLERFDLDSASSFRLFMTSNDHLVQAMTSVYTLRNSIAHGGDANSGLKGVMDLYAAAKETIDGLINATE